MSRSSLLSIRILTFASALVLLSVTSGCKEETQSGKSPATARPTAKIRTAVVGTMQFSDQVEALGTVRAAEAIELSPTVTERIAEVAFEDGDEVKEGKLLVRLEDAEERAKLKAAEAELEKQEGEIERLKDLVSDGAVSEVRLQEHRTLSQIASQRIEEAKAQIKDRRIEAPFDGLLGFRRVSLGALVSPGDLITTLDVLDPVKLDFTVPETFLSDLGPGQEITALTEAYPDEEFGGKVTRVDTRINEVTRSVTVRAEVNNPDLRLRPGMLMTTTLRKNPGNSLSIPERAVVSVQSKRFVFVLSSDDDGSKSVKRTSIEIGRRLPGFVEVIDGLKEGELIVADGLLGLSDGSLIEVIGEFEAPADPYQPESL